MRNVGWIFHVLGPRRRIRSRFDMAQPHVALSFCDSGVGIRCRCAGSVNLDSRAIL